MKNYKARGQSRHPVGKSENNGPKTRPGAGTQKRENYISRIIPKTISRARSDIATWQAALRQADNAQTPRRIKLHTLYKDILLDAHLSSQIELRTLPVLATPFVLKTAAGEIDEDATKALVAASWVTRLNRLALEAAYYGPTLTEFDLDEGGGLRVRLIPRANLIPESGDLLFDESAGVGVKYREVREFGTWLLEFGEADDFGLLNKAVPHVLFMRFAQSCWSELCEIYAIPPRFIKTDTTDPAMLDRAEAMLRDMGAAAYFIIDLDEQFEFAKGVDTNGDVYKNLMSVCKEAISILINSAQIGQDTVNGNRSKEETSMILRDEAVAADREKLAGYWNEMIIPALVRIGVLPSTVTTFEFRQAEDLDALFDRMCQLLPYRDVPGTWIEDKFGIPTTDKAPAFGAFGPTRATAELGALIAKATRDMPKRQARELRQALGKLINAQRPAPVGGRDFFA